MTQKILEDYLWGAANILRGMIDAADFKQYIFPLLFFKRVSDIRVEVYEEALKLAVGDMDYARSRENHQFQTPDGCADYGFQQYIIKNLKPDSGHGIALSSSRDFCSEV